MKTTLPRREERAWRLVLRAERNPGGAAGTEGARTRQAGAERGQTPSSPGPQARRRRARVGRGRPGTARESSFGAGGWA